MRYPQNLNKGDNIGIIAPSFGAASSPYRERMERSLDNIRKEGFNIVCGPNTYLGEGLGKSNTPEACAAEIMDFFTEREVKAILSAGGGETMCEDLRYVDFEKLAKADPKWFCGYSDNTNLTFTLAAQCDIASIYGPCAGHFWSEPLTEPVREMLEILKGERNTVKNRKLWERYETENDDPFAPANLSEPFNMKLLLPGEACDDIEPEGKSCMLEGRLIGGCLDCLQILAGTPYAGIEGFVKRYRDEGIVWFLEACDLNPMAVRRAIWQLREAGWFEGAVGFLIGRPYRFDDEVLGMNRYNAVTGVLAELKVPVIMDLDIGHTEPMMPLVTGCFAKVHTGGNSIAIEQSFR